MQMSLTQIATQVQGVRIIGDGNTLVSGITHDSRAVKPGHIFAALRGENVDGTRFVESAIALGAAAVLCDVPLAVDIPQLEVDNPRARLGEIAAACFGNPSRSLRLAGVTGTNGKTTITYLVETILQFAGMECGVMGTVEYRYREDKWHADHTTPESTVIQGIMRSMVDAGANALAMEVSSHGLVQGRLNGCEFDVVAFTNLTQDHLDFHHSMQEYGAAKMRLFTDQIASRPDAKIVVNIDDAFGAEIVARVAHPVTTVSTFAHPEATLCPVSPPAFTIDGISAQIATPQGVVNLKSGLCGEFNLSNLLVAFGICSALGVSHSVILSALETISSVPGRLERVQNDLGFSVFVDYAHTPDALENVLRAVAPMTTGRVICVFGCGGDRDGAKRPLMGAAVAKAADIAIITSDNPRTEDPARIIEMVVPGVLAHQSNVLSKDTLANADRGYLTVLDRREAIECAIAAARPGDTVLLAGKGHEDYVIVGREKRHFDDREEAARALQNRKG